MLLIFSNSSFAWGTRDFDNNGPHPELLPIATCSYTVGVNFYRSGPYTSSHSYSGAINGMTIIGDGSGGANTSLGIGGTGIYVVGNTQYFVGRFVTTVMIREGGREGNWLTYYDYQICAASAVSYSYTTTQDQAAACPATRPSGYILQRRTYEVWTDGSARNFGAWYNVADYCSAVYSYTGYQNQNVACPATTPSGTIVQQRSYQVYTDGSVVNYSAWSTISNTCVAVYKSTGYNTTTNACPATQPSGIITLQQSYQIFTDGSIRNYSTWSTVSNTCTAVYKSTQTATKTLACPAPYSEGGNGITQTQTSELWTDGTTHNVSTWATTANTCYKTVSDVRNNKTSTCAEGQTGSIVTQEVRTHKEYVADTTKVPALTAAQIAALNDQNGTTWTTVTLSNTCTNVPDKVTTTAGSRVLSCAGVYGGLASDYTGSVVESGTNVSTYSSTTKQTTTVFKSNTPPTYNSTCTKNSLSDVVVETTTQACPTGFTGIITLSRYASIDSSGNKTYPNGTNYVESSNTCVNTVSSADTTTNTSNTVTSKGLLINNTIKTSSLASKTDMVTFINSLDKTTIDANNTYKLNLIVDDLSTGTYNKTNVVNTVNAFKAATGKSPIITVPQTLDKYIGNGGLTADNVKTKVLKSAVLNSNNQVVVTYSDLTKGITTGKNTSFTINLMQ